MVWFVLSEPCLQLEMLLIRSPHSFTYASLHTVAEAVRLTASTRNPWREKCGGSQITRRGVSIGSSREHTQHREGPIDRGRFDSSCTCQGVVGGTTATEARTAPPTPRSSGSLPRSGRHPSDLRRRVEIGSCGRDPFWNSKVVARELPRVQMAGRRIRGRKSLFF